MRWGLLNISRMKASRYSPIFGGSFRTFFVALILLLVAGSPLAASNRYGITNRLDSILLLAPPPIEGTPEYEADLETARRVFHGRTPEQEAKALKLQKLVIFNFAPAIGDFLQPGKFPKTEEFFEKIMKPEIRPSIDRVKNHWDRKRPYQVDTNLWLGKPEINSSYPSGHSTVGMIQALVLAELFPDKREAILEIGRDIGWSRVVIGKHFPTDVHAGRVLAQAIVREMMASPEFQKDLAEVKAEIRAVLEKPGK